MAQQVGISPTSCFQGNAALIGVVSLTCICPCCFPGNCPRRTPTCKCTWRRRATRRSAWVAPTRSCCGVCRRASWAHACLPAPPPSIATPLDQVPLHAHTPTINENTLESFTIFNQTLSGMCQIFLKTHCRVFLSVTTVLHFIDGHYFVLVLVFWGSAPRPCDAFLKSNSTDCNLT